MKIEDQTIEQMAALAKLKLEEKGTFSKEQVKQDLERLLSYIEKMNQLDTEGIKPMTHVVPLNNVFREDTIQTLKQEEIARESLLCHASKTQDGYFVVPQTIEEEESQNKV